MSPGPLFTKCCYNYWTKEDGIGAAGGTYNMRQKTHINLYKLL
jgi:hypothetical protein